MQLRPGGPSPTSSLIMKTPHDLAHPPHAAAPRLAVRVASDRLHLQERWDEGRANERAPCDLRFTGGGASLTLSGRVTDMSATGLFLATRQYVPVGKEVHIELELTSGKVEVVAEVRWLSRGGTTRAQGFGVRLLRISADGTRALQDATWH